MWSCDLIHSCAHTLALDGGVQKLICCSSLLFSFVFKGIISFDGVSIEVCKVRSSVFACTYPNLYKFIAMFVVGWGFHLFLCIYFSINDCYLLFLDENIYFYFLFLLSRGSLKSPWSRRRRKHALLPKQWKTFFTPDGKLSEGGVKFLKKVRSGVCYYGFLQTEMSTLSFFSILDGVVFLS